METNKKAENLEITVKLSGSTIEKVIAMRGEREKQTGKIVSIVELVREAIEYWYNMGGNK
jgi:hypothetical protein